MLTSSELKEMAMKKVLVLGLNGHIGMASREAFAGAGYAVSGFGRSNRHPDPRVRFIKGDADSVADMRAAMEGHDLIVNGFNLPYDKWGDGRYEALTQRVLEAMGASGKTMMFPGNIYN